MSIKNKLLIVLFLGIAFFGLSMVLGSTKKVNAQSYSLSASVPTDGCSSTNRTRFEFSWSGPTAPGTMQLRIWEDQFSGAPDAEPLVTSHSISVADSDSGSWTWTSTRDNFQFVAYIYFFGYASNGVAVVPNWTSQCRPDLEIRNASGGTSPVITGPVSVNVGQSVTYTALTRNDDSAYVLNSSTTRASTTGSTNNSQTYSVPPLNPRTNSSVHSFPTSWNTPGTYKVNFDADVDNTVVEDSNSNNHEELTVVVNAVLTPDFIISISPPSQTVIAGGTAPYTVTLTSINGYTGTVNLTDNLSVPSGSDSFAPSSVSLGSGGTSTFTVITNIATPANTYNFTVTGNDGTRSHSAIASLIVTAVAGQPDLETTSVYPTTPDPLVVGTNRTFTATIQNRIGATATAAANSGRFCIDSIDENNCYISSSTQLGAVSPIPSLNVGVAVTRNSENWLVTAGNHTVYFCADVTTVVSESDESAASNCASQTISTTSYNSWLKTERGDVGSQGRINLSLPYDPAAENNADYLVIWSGATNAVIDTAKSWLVGGSVTPYSLTLPEPKKAFNVIADDKSLYSEFRDKITGPAIVINVAGNQFPNTPGFYQFETGNVTWKDGFEAGSCNSDAVGGVVIFVDGALTIDDSGLKQFTTSCPVVVVVKGTIRVEDAITRVDAVLISNDRFRAQNSDKQLLVNGGIYSSLAGGDAPIFDRVYDGTLGPSEHLIFNPRILWALASTLGSTKTTYQEVNP